jgi:cytochrome oxidase Cu insertion factor (SCO1/SenC/PrrC family)
MLTTYWNKGRGRAPRWHRALPFKTGLLTMGMLAFLIALAGAFSWGCGSGDSSTVKDADTSSVTAESGFSGVTLDGTEVSLSDSRGKPLVLVFMATW